MSEKVNKIEDPREALENSDITSVDPTKIGGLDKDVPQEFDENTLEWTKSRGKKKGK
jgi:hypothetical protein